MVYTYGYLKGLKYLFPYLGMAENSTVEKVIYFPLSFETNSMRSLKTKNSLLLLCLPMLFLQAQGELKSVEGYSPNIGSMVYMLEDLKERITEQVKNLDQTQTDFQYDADANSMDRAVNVYHLRRMKVSSANQVHEIDSFWC